MDEIPRYKLKPAGDHLPGLEVMTEVHDGRFVRHLDYCKVLDANDALEARVAELEAIVRGEVLHRFQGDCPDLTNKFKSRDPLCPACRALGA